MIDGTKFKEMEVFSNLEIDGSKSFIVRLDGWHFHSFTKQMDYAKPFDQRLIDSMSKCVEKMFVIFKPKFCYYFSDELSFMFNSADAFTRVEKLDSLMASQFSSMFSLEVGRVAAFDARIIVPPTRQDIAGYLDWRQADCIRNHIQGWAEWTMRNKLGLSPMVASKRLRGLNSKALAEVCTMNGIDLAKTPNWQRNGMIAYSKTHMKEGFNPITKEKVLAMRNGVFHEAEVPRFFSPEGKEFLRTLLGVEKP